MRNNQTARMGMKSPVGDLLLTSDGQALVSIEWASNEEPSPARFALSSPASGRGEEVNARFRASGGEEEREGKERRTSSAAVSISSPACGRGADWSAVTIAGEGPLVGASPYSVLFETQRQLGEYFAGTRREFNLPLAPRGSTFSLHVWSSLHSIPLGRPTTYGALARALGAPNKARAVGRACATNPLPIVVPCHRVIATNGKLQGFLGGLEAKRWLLAHEVELAKRFVLDGGYDNSTLGLGDCPSRN